MLIMNSQDINLLLKILCINHINIGDSDPRKIMDQLIIMTNLINKIIREEISKDKELLLAVISNECIFF